MDGKIDLCEYAHKGHLTADALLYMLQAIYEAADSGDVAVEIFFADFSKGFDLIHCIILMEKLCGLDFHRAFQTCISALLNKRQQATRIGRTLSDWKKLNGVPQGTKLGVILFAIITNKLLYDWCLRMKCVDDTSALETTPWKSISLLNTAVSDEHNFAVAHNMKLNPIKCKEMFINCLHNSNFC